jgi:hypothetical protein
LSTLFFTGRELLSTHFLTMTRFFRDIRHTIGQYQRFS